MFRHQRFRSVQDTAICDNCDEMIPPEDRICPGCDTERSTKVRMTLRRKRLKPVHRSIFIPDRVHFYLRDENGSRLGGDVWYSTEFASIRTSCIEHSLQSKSFGGKVHACRPATRHTRSCALINSHANRAGLAIPFARYTGWRISF